MKRGMGAVLERKRKEKNEEKKFKKISEIPKWKNFIPFLGIKRNEF